MKTFLMGIFLLIFRLSAYEYEVSAVAIFQDEARFLPEWIEYHHKIGVEHFWMYNNNSKDDYKKALEPYIKKGWVELVQWPSKQEKNDFLNFSYTVQPAAYTDAIQKAKKRSKWLAVIDTDEFIFPIKHKNIIQMINKHKDADEILLSWLVFGTSNVEKIEKNESMLRKLVYSSKLSYIDNKWSKCIVRTSMTDSCGSPHHCRMLPGSKTILLDRSEARINHYWTRDNDFLMNGKIARYQQWGSDPSYILEKAKQLNEVFDDSILIHLK